MPRRRIGDDVIQVNYQDSRPIYQQVHDGFRRQILGGVLRPGDQLPSVRELSTRLAVNPNTVQRAYRELEQEGCVYSVRGKGSFVADASDAARAHQAELLGRFDSLVQELQALGVTPEQLRQRLEGGTT
ncbi:GntR family transcriptional regulator [Parafannyhessea umbonata]|uniref:GntR family transcriptional regulator n=1 Tax=Parafannyhessea umbonata TaxID=604330 RepID=UPI0012B1F19F|nr:GntR family transcriptional regulator [Parafannyhessea umbonata]